MKLEPKFKIGDILCSEDVNHLQPLTVVGIETDHISTEYVIKFPDNSILNLRLKTIESNYYSLKDRRNNTIVKMIDQ
jgi:hypothetical protein